MDLNRRRPSTTFTNIGQVKGVLENNGHSIVFRATGPSEVQPPSLSGLPFEKLPNTVNISGGPLSYSYTFDSVQLHFGRTDSVGSEHTISGLAFPAEVGLRPNYN